MAYADDYVKTNWVNNTTPAINQSNLNHLEGGVKTNCTRISNLSTTKAEETDMLVAFKSVSFDSATGTFTFTKFDNTTVTVNTDIEKIAINFDYDDDPTSPHYQNLVIELDDGTYKYVDMSALITQYEFTNSSTIAFTVSAGGAVTANVIDGSITEQKLQPNFLADCRSAKSDAEAAATAAEGDSLDAEAWANGTRNGTPVGPSDPAYEKSSKWWAEHGGSNSLTGLTDVNITSPTDGQVLKYDFNTQKWINANDEGGIAPNNVSGLSLTPGNNKVTIKWSDPADTVISGVTICTWSKTKLVMKTGSYPSNENDGTLVVTNSVRDQYSVNGYEVTGLTSGTTYYFQLFPISDGGAVNRNVANRVNGTPQSTVTITLMLNGASEDTITIKNSEDETVGTCVFGTEATSGTFSVAVDTGYSDSWTFTSVVTGYVKTATVTSALSQTVNVMPEGAIYWHGNEIEAFSVGTFTSTSAYDYPATTTISKLTNVLNVQLGNPTQTGNSYFGGITSDNVIDFTGKTKCKFKFFITPGDYANNKLFNTYASANGTNVKNSMTIINQYRSASSDHPSDSPDLTGEVTLSSDNHISILLSEPGNYRSILHIKEIYLE